MRLCGISSRFQLLSPCVRQVIHALLTRPPLSHRTINPEGDQVKCFVRLACVKHAASVHPEPGSNSHKKFFPFQNQLANFNHSLIPNVTVLGCFDFRLCFVLSNSFQCELLRCSQWIFQGYFTVQLSKFFVVVLATAFIFYQKLLSLSRTFLFFFCCLWVTHPLLFDSSFMLSHSNFSVNHFLTILISFY